MTKQLRGEPLKEAIRQGLNYMYNQTESYTYNSKKLAEFIGTTRVSLNKYSETIDKELKRLDVERRTNNGSAFVEQLQCKIKRLESEKNNLNKELDILRNNHIEIYNSLFLNSYDMSQLIKPIILTEVLNDKCPLCNAHIDISKPIKTNVVQLNVSREKINRVRDSSNQLEGIIFIGLQGSGKTTFFKKNFSSTHEYLSLDAIKTRKEEAHLLKSHITELNSIVIDNTNPRAKERITYIKYLKAEKYHVKGYFFKSTLDACIERNNKRPKKKIVPEAAIRATSKKIQPPTFNEGFDELYSITIVNNEFCIEKFK